jgi:hypothetical protein
MLTEDYKSEALEKVNGISNEELKELLKSIGSKSKRDEWITRAVHVLRKVEFGGTELDYWDSDDACGDPYEDSCCPYCRVVDGHMGDCELHRLLEEAKDINGNQ